MRLMRLRSGEMLALSGAIGLIVVSFLPWYGRAHSTLDAWDTFGPTIVLLGLAVLAALGLAVATVTERTTAIPVAAAVWTTFFGTPAVISAIVRVLERPDHAVGLRYGAWLGLVFALAILAGGWQSLRDERTELYAPARPVPRPPPA